MNYLLIPGSLRSGSLNRKVLKNVERYIHSKPGNQASILDLKHYQLSMYDGDDEEASGVPQSVHNLVKRIQEVNAVVISTPEYNGSISGVLKNMIDWTSRVQPHPWTRKPVLLMAASPGALSGVRTLWHSRVPLEALGAYVSPEMFGLGSADAAFGEEDQLKDPKTNQRLYAVLDNYMRYATQLNG